MSKRLKVIIAVVSIFIIGLLLNQFLVYGKINDVLVDYRILSQSEKIQRIIKNYEVLQCKYDVLNPKFSIVAFKDYKDKDFESYDVAFYSISRPHIFSSDWQIEYTGGTDVKNTTFPELVKMVKEDCYQFQEGHGDYYGDDLAWSYSPYEPEPEKTEEEIAEEEYERWLIDAIDEMREENKE